MDAEKRPVRTGFKLRYTERGTIRRVDWSFGIHEIVELLLEED